MGTERDSPFYIDKSGKVSLGAGPGRKTAIEAKSFSEGLAAAKWYRIDGHVWGFIDTRASRHSRMCLPTLIPFPKDLLQ
jgi:hypothetical protein